MPYIVEAKNTIDLRVPDICPYCLKNNADDAVELKYTKAIGFLPTAALSIFAYTENRYKVPICKRCARLLARLGIVAKLLILVPWALFFLAIFASSGLVDSMLWISVVSSSIGLIILFYRQWMFLKFRIGYQNSESTFFYIRSKNYAEQFSQINSLQYRYRLMLLKLW